MQKLIRWLVCGVWLAAALGAAAATGKVVKVLPHFLDLEGRVALSPSLFDRDAYQAILRKNPDQRSGLRFDIQWKSSKGTHLKLKVEARGMKNGRPQSEVLEAVLPKPHAFGHWTAISMTGDQYKKFGELSAWRVTLWDGDTLLGEHASFLWSGEEPKR